MSILSHPAFGPRVALIYVTVGALIDVWTLVWYFTIGRETQMSGTSWFWVSGLILTGLTLVVLGLVLGPLGRAARQAELPPAEATQAEAAIKQTEAANPQPVAQPTLPAPPAGAVPAPPAGAVPVPSATPAGYVRPAM